MPYSSKDFKESNLNYINKDFASIKSNLIEYAKTYFPNSYKDFNETSPGMMLLEMSAYVGDVLSFYIDQQYREMLLPLAEERKNIINIAKMMGYKIKPIVASHVELTVKQAVGTNGHATNPGPDYSSATVLAEGFQAISSVDSDIIFETLDVVDFTASGSTSIAPDITATDSDTGIATEFTLTRKVRAISGQTKYKTFNISTPRKFLELKLTDTDVIEIIKVEDSNGNEWHQVEYLAQDMVPVGTHYTSEGRTSAYTSIENPTEAVLELPVPYSLEFKRTGKRFTVEVNEDNTTSLVFGNGILRSGQLQESSFLQSEQVGITLPGTSENLITGIDPLLGDEYSTLGETPAHTVLTITYRAGGGIKANVTSGDLTTFNAPTYLKGSGATLTVTNSVPARGGADEESIEEIRQRARAIFTTQNRCVTKADYEARVMSMPAKFGNIAKVYVDRTKITESGITGEEAIDLKPYFDFIGNGEIAQADIDDGNAGVNSSLRGQIQKSINDGNITGNLDEYLSMLGLFVGSGLVNNSNGTLNVSQYVQNQLAGQAGVIDIWTLSYGNSKTLVSTPADPIGINIQKYLSQYRLLTDDVNIKQGFVINFGVLFDVYAHQHANKQEVKFKCIQKVTDYFNIDNMQFRQPINVSQLEYDLMAVDGVRSVNYVCLTQGNDWKGSSQVIFSPPLWQYKWDEATDDWTTNGGTTGYGYLFDFATAETEGMIRPPVTPSVFELKNPKLNVMGRVH